MQAIRGADIQNVNTHSIMFVVVKAISDFSG